MTLMELQQFIDIHVAHTITIGHEERFITHVFLNAFDAPPRHGVKTGIHNCHFPWLGMVLMNGDFVLPVCVVKRHIAGLQEIIREPLLDILLLVPRTDDKLRMPINCILFHDVPQDRHPTYLYHRFWTEDTLFAYPRPESTG